jgi:hypothetical protein
LEVGCGLGVLDEDGRDTVAARAEAQWSCVAQGPEVKVLVFQLQAQIARERVLSTTADDIADAGRILAGQRAKLKIVGE